MSSLLQEQTISIDTLIEKYCRGDEKTKEEIFRRTSRHIAIVESTPEKREYWEKAFYKNFEDGAIGGGRIMATAGSDVGATLINCFSGDTIVLTEEGPFEIKDLVGKSVGVKTVDTVRTAEFRSFGVQDLYSVELSNGDIKKATLGHEWVVRKTGPSKGAVLNHIEKVTTDKLVGRQIPAIPYISRPAMDDEYYKGVAHGIVYGDGSRVKGINDTSFYVYLFGNKHELQEYLEPYCISTSVYDGFGDRAIRIYGINIDNQDLKKVPENRSTSYLYGFVCGLIATDGNVCNGNTTVFQSDLEEINSIYEIIKKVGMAPNAPTMYRENSPYTGKFAPSYVIRIKALSICENDILREDHRQNLILNPKRVQLVTVLAVKPLGICEEVYCAVEPETRTFTIGGNLLTGNCFVQPIADSIAEPDENGYPGIYVALKDAAETMRRGGGVGYDFSLIRPKFSKVKGTSSFASGPCSYINVFDKSCETVESAGARRGAQLAALKITHPDIEEYIVAKREEKRWNNFNVSVMVSDAFMQAVKDKASWELVHTAEPSDYLKGLNKCYQRDDGMWVYKTIDAYTLWQSIMKSNYDFAEPGILFYDNINNDNNLRYTEVINATNPCGEQPLPPYGCCDLGPVILTKFINNPFTPNASFNYNKLKECVEIHVRFLDNVLDATYWPLEKQCEEAMAKRRIGLGFTGLGNALSMLNMAYNTEEARKKAREIAEFMRDVAYKASIDLAKEKGAFPLFDADKYLEEGTFASRLPSEIKAEIKKYGIRNSHLLSIAPTGTVSLAFADNASNGIEPPFSLAYSRKKRLEIGGHKEYIVLDHSLRVALSLLPNKEKAEAIINSLSTGKKTYTYNGLEFNVKDSIPSSIVTALEISAEDHLLMMKVVQPYIDSAISKTINVPADYPFEDFKLIYEKAHKFGLKGVATYRPNSILGSVLSEIKSEEPKPVIYNPENEYNQFMNKDHEKRPKGRLLGCSDEYHYFNQEGEVKFYVGVSFIQSDIKIDDKTNIWVKRPIEIFINSEMNVGNEWSKLLGITMSQWARAGIDKLARYLKTCQKMKSDRGSIRFGYIVKPNGGKAARFHGSDIAVMAFAIQDLLYTEGIFDKEGNPIKYNDLFNGKNIDSNATSEKDDETVTEQVHATGSICTECGSPSVIKKDGCKFCTNCGAEGSCG